MLHRDDGPHRLAAPNRCTWLLQGSVPRHARSQDVVDLDEVEACRRTARRRPSQRRTSCECDGRPRSTVSAHKAAARAAGSMKRRCPPCVERQVEEVEKDRAEGECDRDQETPSGPHRAGYSETRAEDPVSPWLSSHHAGYSLLFAAPFCSENAGPTSPYPELRATRTAGWR